MAAGRSGDDVSRSESIVRAFGEEHVSRLTGLSVGQLRAWDRRGFFSPHYAYEDRRSPYSRVYSFRDVVGLRAIAVLKQKHRSEEHTSELQSLMRISYAVFCLKKNK